MSGLTLITHGMISDNPQPIVYRCDPLNISVQTRNKKINIVVEEIKVINILKIDCGK